uniref:G_PROTEIN_RECEP_F1_2 domain-containing protein n=1 Tax=Caenorhabditis japonica TaxID=281687 RepID=A0A8R1DRL7_CAEJA
MSTGNVTVEISGDVNIFLSKIIFAPAIFAMCINVFHIFIISRRSVMPSSTNAILTGIAFSDIIFALYYVKSGIHALLITGLDKCESAASYEMVVLDWVLAAITDCFRRSSTWLCLFLAVVRTISVKKVLDKSFSFLSNAKFGWKVSSIIIFISSLLTVAYVFRYQIEDVGDIQ